MRARLEAKLSMDAFDRAYHRGDRGTTLYLTIEKDDRIYAHDCESPFLSLKSDEFSIIMSIDGLSPDQMKKIGDIILSARDMTPKNIMLEAAE